MVSDHDFHQSLLIFVIFGAGCLPELRKVMSRSASIFALLKRSWTNLFLSISNKICFSTLNWLLFCSNLAVFTKCSEIFVDLAIMFVENIWVFLKHVAVHAGFLNSGVSTPRHFTTFISPWSIARGAQWDLSQEHWLVNSGLYWVVRWLSCQPVAVWIQRPCVKQITNRRPPHICVPVI